jgi:hypothetical protein
MDVAVDVFVVAVVGFAAALALGMVVGRRRSQETRVLILLLALLGVAGLVHGVRVAYLPTSSNTPTGGGATTSATKTVPTTSAAPTTSTAPTTEQAPARDRTADFIALVPADQYVPADEMKDQGAPGPNTLGAYACRPESSKVAWTYPLGGTYTSFHAVAVPTGHPGKMPTVTFTVYADDTRVFTVALDELGKSAPTDVSLTNVQSLRLEVAVDARDKCNTLVANWSGITVT